jgi:hypothetical protein
MFPFGGPDMGMAVGPDEYIQSVLQMMMQAGFHPMM